MREIKFEYIAKNKKTGTIEKLILLLDDIQKGISGVNFIFFDLLARRQYTGLKDKNGVEIYEGDIVKNIFADGVVSKVFYDLPSASFKAHVIGNNYITDRLDYWPSSLYIINKYEVIGNIYENPELLKADQ